MSVRHFIHIKLTQLHVKGIAGSLGTKFKKKSFVITMNYAQNHDIFLTFFIKVVINKKKAYSFLVISMTNLQ